MKTNSNLINLFLNIMKSLWNVLKYFIYLLVCFLVAKAIVLFVGLKFGLLLIVTTLAIFVIWKKYK